MTSPETPPETYTPVTGATLPPVVTPPPETRFEQLVSLWAELKPQLDALQSRVNELSTGIKNEAMRSAPEGSAEVILRHPALPHPYRVYPREEWRLDSKGLKEKDPETYVRWARKRTTWRMDPVR